MDNHTILIPRWIIDYYLHDMNKSHWAVLECISRKTIGRGTESAPISIAEMSAFEPGPSKATVVRVLTELLEKGIIARTHKQMSSGRHLTSWYSISTTPPEVS